MIKAGPGVSPWVRATPHPGQPMGKKKIHIIHIKKKFIFIKENFY